MHLDMSALIPPHSLPRVQPQEVVLRPKYLRRRAVATTQSVPIRALRILQRTMEIF